DDPMAQTNLENELDAGVVEALLAASEAHVEIAHRWYRRKAALLGLERLDAEPRRGKPSIAFCVWPSTRVPGFVFVNWTGQLRDLVTLAHEFGHGTNFGLAAQAQTDNSLKQGIALAEVPSTFAE